MGVEQQLAASSPGLLFQHALLNAASNGNAAAGEDADAAGTPGAMDMFEAQKMFQKFTSQLATGLTRRTSENSAKFLGNNLNS